MTERTFKALLVGGIVLLLGDALLGGWMAVARTLCTLGYGACVGAYLAAGMRREPNN